MTNAHNHIRGALARGARKARGILWEGRSPIDGARTIAVATDSTANRKTGDMVQIWILRHGMLPSEAVLHGLDTTVCGHCPHRGNGLQGRSCYVQVPQAPDSIMRSVQAGTMPRIAPRDLAGRQVRWGAYGDPAVLPEGLVRMVNGLASGWTGYTHQWRRPWASWARGILMASVETPAQERTARALGWGTFRAGRSDGTDRAGAVLCAAAREGMSCATCGMCDGRPVAVYIPSHGFGAKHAPANRLPVIA